MTVGDALRAYIAHLEDRQARGKAKEGGVQGVRDTLMRLERRVLALRAGPLEGVDRTGLKAA